VVCSQAESFNRGGSAGPPILGHANNIYPTRLKGDLEQLGIDCDGFIHRFVWVEDFLFGIHSMRRVETQSIRDVATGSMARLSHQVTSSPKRWLSR
jgi:hypothetical protein